MKNKSLLKLQEYIQRGYLSDINKITDKSGEEHFKQIDFWLNGDLEQGSLVPEVREGIDLKQFMLTCLTRQSYEDLKKLALNATITPSIVRFIFDRLDEQNYQYAFERTGFELCAGWLILKALSSRRAFQLLSLEDPSVRNRLEKIRRSYRYQDPDFDSEIHNWSLDKPVWDELMDLVGPS